MADFKLLEGKIIKMIIFPLNVVILPFGKQIIHIYNSSMAEVLLEKIGQPGSVPVGAIYYGEFSNGFIGRTGTACIIDKESVKKYEEGNKRKLSFDLLGKERFRLIKPVSFYKDEKDEKRDTNIPYEAEVKIISEDEKNILSLEPNLSDMFIEDIKENVNDGTLPDFFLQKIDSLSLGRLADLIAKELEDVFLTEEKLVFLNDLNPLSRMYKVIGMLDPTSAFKNEKSKEKGLSIYEGTKTGGSKKDFERLNEEYEKIKNRLSDEAKKKIEEELQKIKGVSPDSSNYQVALSYLNFALSIFALNPSEENNNIIKIKKGLNDDHYGLEKVKERIIEYVAVKILNPQKKSPILCFVGPPGVGKTSLGKSVAKVLGRKFCRWSAGGVSDEAEIRGHRATYVGALPGRILQAIKNSGTNNPIFMIDEVDKLGRGSSSRGDPESALLEVLDPEQNFSFSDHYLQIGFDLSKVFFIVTANTIDTIPPALKDRMEVLYIPGYSEEEKINIANNFLIPRQRVENGLSSGVILKIASESLRCIIRDYTNEAGVRNLEREIANIFRKLAIKKLEENNAENITFDILPTSIPTFLGHKRFFLDEVRECLSGVSVGLAVTANGNGKIIFVESSIIIKKGSGKLILTGHIGQVMEESAKIALNYLRSKIKSDSVNKTKNDIHINVPAGAIPKDGPSAGLAMLFSLYSLFKSKSGKHCCIKENLAVTGEITLRGEVLPIGGVKEKILGAIRAGIKEVILPKKNEGDFLDLNDEIKGNIKIHFVSKMDEALNIAFPERKK